MEGIEAKKETYKEHSRIKLFTHKFKGDISWEKALEQVINNQLKRLKFLD